MHRHLVVAAILWAPLLCAQASLADLGWIAGHWTGTIGTSEIEEHWIAPAGGAMLGVSRTVSNRGGQSRMSAFEFLRIEQRTDGIYYVAQPQGRAPTDFKLTKTEKGLAVFENPQHDMPKIIAYRLEDASTLVASIEGDEGGQHRRLEFRFKLAGGAPK